ncbi:4a-hydroxytetrahydrobiopterin dehydratase [Patescibacteria group bacterium]|nr:4a-hydroxytetrahydrobiopterin dehydratase [Patescibacteria group bacterium]
MSGQLTQKKCIACEGGIPSLTDEGINKLMPQIPGWELTTTNQDGAEVKALTKELIFKDFRAVMTFLRKVEELAEAEGHHPDFSVHYNHLVFTIWTHAISGLHENDFIMAAKIDQLNN